MKYRNFYFNGNQKEFASLDDAVKDAKGDKYYTATQELDKINDEWRSVGFFNATYVNPSVAMSICVQQIGEC